MHWLDETPTPAARQLFCNRSLSLRHIAAVGFDMDYTLVHYRTDAWEAEAYRVARDLLVADGWPVGHLAFDPLAFTRGLVLDLDLGNVVKPNRFGVPKAASHGTPMMDRATLSQHYARAFVDLRDGRWRFLNTMFSLSEACLFAQLVDRHDAGDLPDRHRGRPVTFATLHAAVSDALARAHTEGHIKAAVVAAPERFVVPDPDIALALTDLSRAGKKLALITNSDWSYTRQMMSWAFDPYLPGSWRDLFDLVLVGARKPDFFTTGGPVFSVADEDKGLLCPQSGPLTAGRAYHGGSAALVERTLGVSGPSMLYFGDHLFADVNVSKKVLRWRTALVVRELEREQTDADGFAAKAQELSALMTQKQTLEVRMSRLRLARQRLIGGYGPRLEVPLAVIDEALAQTHQALVDSDAAVAPLVAARDRLGNQRWGPLFHAGNDKSHFARQVERYADLYTSRVSNLLLATPFETARSRRGSLPHAP